MLHHYAMTPECFEQSTLNEMMPTGTVTIQVLRGLCDSGLLANLHGGEWITEVKKRQEKVREKNPDVWRRIESLLCRLSDNNRIVRHQKILQADDKDECIWLRRAYEHHRQKDLPFSAILSTDTEIELSSVKDSVVSTLMHFLDTSTWDSRITSGTLKKTQQEFCKWFEPTLKYAQKLTLIDKYMSCLIPRFFDTIENCSILLGKSRENFSSGSITIHAGHPEYDGPEYDRESINSRLQRWQEKLQPLADHWGHRYQVILWGKKPGGPTLHDRYLITDQICISIPGGLDFDNNERRANETDWAFLTTKRQRELLHEEYNHVKSPFKYLDNTKVLPKNK